MFESFVGGHLSSALASQAACGGVSHENFQTRRCSRDGIGLQRGELLQEGESLRIASLRSDFP